MIVEGSSFGGWETTQISVKMKLLTKNRRICNALKLLTKWHIHLNKAPSFPHDFSGNPDKYSN